MYERLAKVLDLGDESHTAAREVLEALRDPTSEVIAAGISADRWRAAVDGMLASADAADQAQAGAAASKRKALWPAIRRDLEGLGCLVRRSSDAEHVWEIEARGVYVEADLSTGEIEGLCLLGVDDAFARLAELIGKELEERRLRVAEEARREQLRRTHTWVNKKKAWVPNSGEGPLIRGGGTAKS